MFEDSFNVFLLGRPNVGKSSLFNFLSSKNDALVQDQEGTTMDWRSHKIGNILIWDSPGSFSLKKLSLPAKVDYIYFVIENLVLDSDKRLYLELKKRFSKVLVIINKIDKGEDFDYSFFDNYIKISLRSRFNIFQLKTLFLDNYKAIETPEKKTWAILGKPNVGKSSLINSILNFDLHRVQDLEGTTKEFLPVEVSDNILLDTPGQRGSVFFPRYNNIFGVVVVTDLDNQKQDLKLINLAVKRNKPVLVVINKVDLVKNNQQVVEIKEKLENLFLVSVVLISCMKKRGVREVVRLIEKMEKAYCSRISTGVLNSWLSSEIKRHEPRLKFISQVETSFPKFYINCPLSKDKERMLKKKIADRFGFRGIPIKIIFSK